MCIAKVLIFYLSMKRRVGIKNRVPVGGAVGDATVAVVGGNRSRRTAILNFTSLG